MTDPTDLPRGFFSIPDLPREGEGPGTLLRAGPRTILWLASVSVILVVLLFIAGQFLQMLNLPFGLMLTSLFIFGLAGLTFPAAFNLDPKAFTGLIPQPRHFLLIAALVAAVNLPLANFLMGTAHELLPKSWSAGDELMTNLFQQAGWGVRLLLIIAAAVVAPVGEELFFRGWLQTLLTQQYSIFTSIFWAAVVFSFAHFDAVGFVARVELGILFGLVRYWSGSLWPAIALHGTHNLLSVLTFLNSTPDATDTLVTGYEWIYSFIFAIGSFIGMILLLRLFRGLTDAQDRLQPWEIPDSDRVPLLWTPQRAKEILFPAGITFAVLVAGMAVTRNWLPGAELTHELLHPTVKVTAPLQTPHGPHPKNGSSHPK